jgi:hypothetical protein
LSLPSDARRKIMRRRVAFGLVLLGLAAIVSVRQTVGTRQVRTSLGGLLARAAPIWSYSFGEENGTQLVYER